MLERTPAFSSVGHIRPLLNGILLVSDSEAAIVRDRQIRRRYTADQIVIDAPLTVIDESRAVVYLVDNGLGQQGITAWHYEENRVLWRQALALPIQNLWLDAESNLLHTLVAPEYGKGETRYEVRFAANGEVKQSAGVEMIALELGIEFETGGLSAEPLLVPNTTLLLLFVEQEYPEEGAVVSVIDLVTKASVQQWVVSKGVSDAKVTGNYLALESFPNLLSIWDLASGEQVNQLALSAGYNNIQFFDYPHIVFTDDQKTLSHYNFEKSTWRSVENPSSENFHAAGLDLANNELVATGYRTEELMTFGAPVPVQKKHVVLKANLVSADSYEYVHGVVTNGKNLAVLDNRAGGVEDQSWLWQLDRARPLRQLSDGVPLALSNDNRRLMSIHNRDQVAMVDVHTGQITRLIRAPQYVMFQPRFTGDGREAWLLKDNATISILNTWSDQIVGQLPLLLPVEASKLQSVETSLSVRADIDQQKTCHQLLPDQNMLALCLVDEPLLILSDVLTGEIRASVLFEDLVQTLFPLATGGYFVLDRGNTGYWLDEYATVTSKFALPITETVNISVDDIHKRIALVSREEGVKVFDNKGQLVLALSKEELETDYNLYPDHAEFVQAGDALLLAGPGHAMVLPLTDSARQRDLVSVSDSIQEFEIDSAQSLLNITVQGQARHNIVWDLSTGAELQRFEAGDLMIGPARNLFGKAAGFDDATRRYDLSAATWHEMPSLPVQTDLQQPMPSFSLETRILFHAVTPAVENEAGQLKAIEQVLLKTEDKVLWITKSLTNDSTSSGAKSKILSTVALPALLPYLTNVVFGAHVVVQGSRLALFSNKTILFVSLENGEVLWRQTVPSYFDEVNFFVGKGLDFINDGAYLSFAVKSSEKDIEVTHLIFDVVDGSYEEAFTNIGDIDSFEDKPDWLFLPDGQRALALKLFSNGNIELVDAISKATLRQLRGHIAKASSAHLLDNGRRLITSSDERTLLWRLDAQVEPVELNVGKIQRAEIASGLIWILTETGKLEIHQTDGSRLAELVSMRDGGWLVVSDDGRYDSNTPGNLDGIGWVVSDAPLEALPIEVFMKQYYEPRLLPRLIGKDRFAEVKNLAEINRVQPTVNILGVEAGSRESLGSNVSVTVEVRAGITALENMVLESMVL
ncbi:MAG: WD40 repeat protein, partial [Litorivivens sp.]